jgi:hypothetical protein
MKKPHLILIAGSLVLGGLCTTWWMQRSTVSPRPAQVTAQAAAHMEAPVVKIEQPAPAPPAPAAKPSPVPVRPKAAIAPMKKALQSPENVPAQRFSLHADRDTLLRSKGGCTVKVPANAFVDANGRQVKGPVHLELREVLRPVDFVMGNMVTVYQGKALESGGSFCLEASANGEALALAEGKLIDMAIPTRGAKSGMKFFPGKVEGNGIEWQAPRELIPPAPSANVNMVFREAGVDAGAVVDEPRPMRTNAWYRVERFSSLDDAPKGVRDGLMKLWWSGDGLMITRDSVITVAGHEVTLTPGDTVDGFAQTWNATSAPDWDGALAASRSARRDAAPKGTNMFNVDPATNYIFQVKQLGWANIDRLLYDKRSRPVDIITRIDNKEVGDVCISMVVKSHGMFLPGYEMRNGTYSFSHGDFEKMQLPVGAKAIVLATAYRDGKPHLAMQEITITEKLNVDLHLEPIGADDLREELEARL